MELSGGMRRSRLVPDLPHRELTDENGQPLTFATPGEPTLEERRRYAVAIQRATTPPRLTKEQRAVHQAAMQQHRGLFPHLYNN